MTDQDPLVRFAGVRKSYGTFEAVKGIDLDIGRGEFVAIMGPSGCGKTTTLRMLAGLEAPSAGDITLDGRVMNDVPAHERDTPLVWQSLALFPFLNVRENVEFGLKMRGVSKMDSHGRAMMWLERLGLKGFENRRIDQLSGGQRQRVALARSLVTEPQMLLLDEPLSALDAHLVIRMQGVLTRLQRELGITFVYVTHSQSEAFAMADRVVILSDGRVQQIGAPKQVHRAPANRFVARFVGANTILDGAMTGAGTIETPVGTFGIARGTPPPAHAAASLLVPADRVTLSTEATGATNEVAAEVLTEEFTGSFVTVMLRLSDGTEMKVQKQQSEIDGLDLRPGARLFAGWPAEVGYVLPGEEC